MLPLPELDVELLLVGGGVKLLPFEILGLLIEGRVFILLLFGGLK